LFNVYGLVANKGKGGGEVEHDASGCACSVSMTRGVVV
jgi:hypothetical protein